MSRAAMIGGGALALSATNPVSAQEDDETDEDNEDEQEGYTDTPIIPGTDWHVHDPARPDPPVVDPGAPALQDSPSDATILFDGGDLDNWEHPDGRDPEWRISSNCMEIAPGTGSLRTEESLGDGQLYLEWRVPEGVEGTGQNRGNSGVHMMEQYEIQILDSYENPTYADGSNAAIYGQYPPLVNASRPQGKWQTFNIFWTAPRFDDDNELESPAEVTVVHNGIIVHNNRELIGPVAHRDIADYSAHPPEAPMLLQDHDHPVQFKDIWFRPID